MHHSEEQQEVSEATVSESVVLSSRFPRACGFVRIKPVGTLEIELYDRGQRAEDCFDAEVAIIYTVAAAELPQFFRLLQGYSLTNHAATLAPLSNMAQLPQILAGLFTDVEQLIGWISDQGIEYSRRFDTDV